jgi:hypothetical protein
MKGGETDASRTEGRRDQIGLCILAGFPGEGNDREEEKT